MGIANKIQVKTDIMCWTTALKHWKQREQSTIAVNKQKIIYTWGSEIMEFIKTVSLS